MRRPDIILLAARGAVEPASFRLSGGVALCAIVGAILRHNSILPQSSEGNKDRRIPSAESFSMCLEQDLQTRGARFPHDM